MRLWRETKLGLNCCKSENNLKEILDSKVGFSDWLGRSAVYPLPKQLLKLLYELGIILCVSPTVDVLK